MGRAEPADHFRQGRERYYSCWQPAELHHLLTLFHFHPLPFHTLTSRGVSVLWFGVILLTDKETEPFEGFAALHVMDKCWVSRLEAD